jgi:hypothetical protein
MVFKADFLIVEASFQSLVLAQTQCARSAILSLLATLLMSKLLWSSSARYMSIAPAFSLGLLLNFPFVKHN